MSVAHDAVEAVRDALVPAQRGKPLAKYCPWCSPYRDRSSGAAAFCACDERCGETVCPYEEDVFVPPPVPIFNLEVNR